MFTTWKFGSVQFLAFENGNNAYSIVDEFGRNYGSWMDVEGFRKAQKGNKDIATPINGSIVRIAIHWNINVRN